MMPALPEIPTRVFAALPDELRLHDTHSDWTRRRGGPPLHSFLEGPSFDREGNFYCVDVAHGRIFKVTPDARWQVFANTGGNPNGLKIHRDGRIFVADNALGLMVFDPHSAALLTHVEGFGGERFRGLNDLVFANNGDLYLTDPGESSVDDPHGRVLCRQPDGRIETVIDGLAYPNGVVLSPNQRQLYVAVSGTLQVLRGRIDGARVKRWAVQLQFNGGLAGPDGLAALTDGSLLVAHSGLATVWLTDALAEPRARIRSCAGVRTTNVAFHPQHPGRLFITESEQGVILQAELDAIGQPMFSHA